MSNGKTQCGASRRFGLLRLRAAALALLFAGLTLLPWLHIVTADGRPGHMCCGSAHSRSASSGPAVTLAEPGSADSCWICQSLFALLQHTVASGAAQELCVSERTAFVAHAPQAPVIRLVDPATRSQAPPAHV